MVRGPAEFDQFPKALTHGFGPYRGLSRPDMRYDDGDSLWFWMDWGFSEYAFVGVRLLGINAPGTRYPEAKTEEERTKGVAAKLHLLGEVIPLNTPVVLHTDQDPEKYDRG